jgi:class 3 adenylate cyclase
MSLVWDSPESILDVIEEFLTGARRTNQPGRVLATVLFTDIVGSTERATRLGDRRWRELLTVHDQLTRRLVEESHGQLIQTTGDGMLARGVPEVNGGGDQRVWPIWEGLRCAVACSPPSARCRWGAVALAAAAVEQRD